MTRYQTYFQLLLLVLTVSFLSACEKKEYDLFPLEEGNEFYYSYYKYRFNGISVNINGTERWKVISVSSKENSKIYRIERKLDAVLRVAGQTIIISDSLRFFEIYEDKSSAVLSSSSMLLDKEISFKRFQSVPVFEIKQESQSIAESWSFSFKADSGLTRFSYHHPPNHTIDESLHLDSLKIFR